MSVAANPGDLPPVGNAQPALVAAQPAAQPKPGDVRFDPTAKLFIMTLEGGNEVSVHQIHGVNLNGAALQAAGKIQQTIDGIKSQSAAIQGALKGNPLGQGMHTITFENDYKKSTVTNNTTGQTTTKELSLSQQQIQHIKTFANSFIRQMGVQNNASNQAAVNAHAGMAPDTHAAAQAGRNRQVSLPARGRHAGQAQAAPAGQAQAAAPPTVQQVLRMQMNKLKEDLHLQKQVLDAIRATNPNDAAQRLQHLQAQIQQIQADVTTLQQHNLSSIATQRGGPARDVTPDTTVLVEELKALQTQLKQFEAEVGALLPPKPAAIPNAGAQPPLSPAPKWGQYLALVWDDKIDINTPLETLKSMKAEIQLFHDALTRSPDASSPGMLQSIASRQAEINRLIAQKAPQPPHS